MKFLILGGSGQLGSEFLNFLKIPQIHNVYSFSHSELDIANYENLLSKFLEIRPDVVINCAAFTNVDKAEEQKDECIKANTVGAKNASFAAFKVSAKIIYFSTDYVFDGNSSVPYKETDGTNPLSFYGKTKLMGEEYTKVFNPNHLILRVSWLYGIYGNNFVKTVINLSKSRKELNIVDDQYGVPTYTLDVVRQTWELITSNSVGLYHSSNQGCVSRFELANFILDNLKMLNVKINPIKTSEYRTLAVRPKYSVLDNYFLKLEGKNIMRGWEDALCDFLNTYKEKIL